MSFINGLKLKISRAESRPYRFLKRVLAWMLSPTVPRLPRPLLSPLRAVYEFHYLVIAAFRTGLTLFYRGPLFQARCASFGRGVRLEGLPFVSGHVEVHVGSQVLIGAHVSIMSGRIFEHPRLVLEDRSSVGWNTVITVNREVIIEEDAIVSYDCRISDSDAHPRDAEERARHKPPSPQDVRPVRIGKKAFVGNGSHIMKGVTIGEGSMIGANSVVISNIPPYCLAMGNPAEIFIRNYGRPKPPRPPQTPPAAATERQNPDGTVS